MTASPSKKPVVIVGGGLAGLAAAVRLAEHQVPTTVIETRMRLGGRATSFVDPTSQALLDNCQHVLMRCCTNLIDLYQRLGVMDHFTWHRTLYWADARGRADTLEADDWPAPLHMSRSMARFKLLTWREKLAISRAMLAMMRTRLAQRDALDALPFSDWLKQHHQPQSAIDKYWEVVVVSACNETLDRVSSRYAIQVFAQGFLNHPDAYEMGLANVPLVKLYDPAQSLIHDAGGQLHLQTGAEGFVYDGQRITGLKLRDGQVIPSDTFISAVPFDRLDKLASPDMRDHDARLQQLDRFTVSPIIGIHLTFRTPAGEPVMKRPHLILQQSPIQWIFNKGDDLAHENAQHLHCVISAAHDWVDQSADALVRMALSALHQAIPATQQAALVHSRVVKEKRATFAVTPDLDAIRPTTQPTPGQGIDNLLLAGDWTATGWPATMEGAVRSGYLAAQAVLEQRGQSVRPLLADDLQPGPLYRMLSR